MTDIPKLGCVQHDCDKCKAAKKERLVLKRQIKALKAMVVEAEKKYQRERVITFANNLDIERLRRDNSDLATAAIVPDDMILIERDVLEQCLCYTSCPSWSPSLTMEIERALAGENE